MEKLFAYGTLINDEILDCVLQSRPNKIPASLSHYKCLLVSNELYPAIVPEVGSFVKGVILNELSHDQWRLLDEYEGDTYQRIGVEVVTEQGVHHACETYVFKPECAHLLSETEWRNEVFREKFMNNFLDSLNED